MLIANIEVSELVETAGHEMMHAMDDVEGINDQYSQEDRETYTTRYGQNFSNYTDHALDMNGYDEGMANTNSHMGNHGQTIRGNTAEFNTLDKTKGDYLLPQSVQDAREWVKQQQEISQQASTDLKGTTFGGVLSVAAAPGDAAINLSDGALTIIDKTTDLLAASGIVGENLQEEAFENIAKDLAALESLYDNKEEIPANVAESLEQFYEDIVDADPAAIRSLTASLVEIGAPVGVLAKINRSSRVDGPEGNVHTNTQANAPNNNGSSVSNAEGFDVPDSVIRRDNDWNNPDRTHFDENGNLVSANPDGDLSTVSHVRGGQGSNSQHISTSSIEEAGPNGPKSYGDTEVEIDTRRLQEDINTGRVEGVEIRTPEQVRADLQNNINRAQERYNNNPTGTNANRLERAQQDLYNSCRDGECLISPNVPADYISTPRPVGK